MKKLILLLFSACCILHAQGDINVRNLNIDGTVTIQGLTGTQCLHAVSGVVTGTGSDCGSGSSGVSQIIAGTNVTISPIGGTGAVTINSTGGTGCVPSGLVGEVLYDSGSGTCSEHAFLNFDSVTLRLQTQILWLGLAGSGHHVGFQPPAALSADTVWSLPATDGTVGQVLSTNGAHLLSWVNNGSGGTGCTTAGPANAVLLDNGSGGCTGTADLNFNHTAGVLNNNGNGSGGGGELFSNTLAIAWKDHAGTQVNTLTFDINDNVNLGLHTARTAGACGAAPTLGCGNLFFSVNGLNMLQMSTISAQNSLSPTSGTVVDLGAVFPFHTLATQFITFPGSGSFGAINWLSSGGGHAQLEGIDNGAVTYLADTLSHFVPGTDGILDLGVNGSATLRWRNSWFTGTTTTANLTISNLTGTGCLQETSGVVSSTGSPCGSGGSGGITTINSQPGPSITLTQGSFIGITAASNSIQISNLGVWGACGTANEVLVNSGTGCVNNANVTFTTPQAIGTTSAVNFGSLSTGGTLRIDNLGNATNFAVVTASSLNSSGRVTATTGFNTGVTIQAIDGSGNLFAGGAGGTGYVLMGTLRHTNIASGSFSVPGSFSNRMPIYDGSGTFIGFVPIF